jgi:hypothetical protein
MDGIEKGIACLTGAVWQLATFWCPERGCQSEVYPQKKGSLDKEPGGSSPARK